MAIQQELVQKWANDNGVDIIHEFADRGKSGLTAEGRDGFHDMMENWVRQRKDFDFVLCLDVRRHATLLEQLRQYPHGAHDDGPEALEMGPRGAGHPHVRQRVRPAAPRR